MLHNHVAHLHRCHLCYSGAVTGEQDPLLSGVRVPEEGRGSPRHLPPCRDTLDQQNNVCISIRPCLAANLFRLQMQHDVVLAMHLHPRSHQCVCTPSRHHTQQHPTMPSDKAPCRKPWEDPCAARTDAMASEVAVLSIARVAMLICQF